MSSLEAIRPFGGLPVRSPAHAARVHPAPLARTGAGKRMVILFGGSGDLARRKVLPALEAVAGGDGAEETEVLVVGRSGSADMLDGLRRGRSESFARRLDFFRMDYDEAGFAALRERCMARVGEGEPVNFLFHLGVPPSAFETIITGLRNSDLIRPPGGPGWSRLLVEKPIGIDGESALRVDRLLLTCFSEEQIYRVDHYLGKPSVHSLVGIRAADPGLDSIWNSKFISQVRITSKETLGCGERAGFFDGVGILRDMVQSHLIQLLGLVAMDIPQRQDAHAFRESKCRTIRQLLPIAHDEGFPYVIRGRYTSGLFQGERVGGYLEEKGVPAESMTETYALVRLFHGSERWSGVPFHLEAGKRMDRKETLVEVVFRKAPDSLPESFAGPLPRRAVFRIQPEGDAFLEYHDGSRAAFPVHAGSGLPGMRAGHGEIDPDGYSLILGHAMSGDRMLSVHAEEVESAWRSLAHVLRKWSTPRQSSDVMEYAPGWSGRFQ